MSTPGQGDDASWAGKLNPTGTTVDLAVTPARDLLATGNTGPLDVSRLGGLHLFARITALAGGATPTVAFLVEREEVPDVWSELYASAAVDAVGAVVGQSIGAGQQLPRSIGRRVRVRWVITGAPTSAAADVVVVGKG